MKTGLILITGILLHLYVFDLVRIQGNAMYPALRDGDLCLLLKPESSHTGDIVLYENDGIKMGRIIAMSGKFNIDNDLPLVNDVNIYEEVFYPTIPGTFNLPVTLKEGQVWIMHDFRSDTDDSRNCGPIDQKQIVGKVLFLFRRRGF